LGCESSFTLSPVEFLKKLFLFCFNKYEEQKTIERIAVDIFILFKFAAVFISFFISHKASILFIAYLCFFNLFTYFYHHIWDGPKRTDLASLRRRYANLFQAIFFNILCFASFYNFMNLNLKIDGIYGDISLSFLNMFLMGDQLFLVKDFNKNYFIISSLQVLTSFIFFTVILSRTEIKDDHGLQK